jgi:hypothetical protein
VIVLIYCCCVPPLVMSQKNRHEVFEWHQRPPNPVLILVILVVLSCCLPHLNVARSLLPILTVTFFICVFAGPRSLSPAPSSFPRPRLALPSDSAKHPTLPHPFTFPLSGPISPSFPPPRYGLCSFLPVAPESAARDCSASPLAHLLASRPAGVAQNLQSRPLDRST